jgi:uncharacterized ParB-like nuclease family protein
VTKRPLPSLPPSVTAPANFDGQTKHLDTYKSIPVSQIMSSDRFIKPTPERVTKMAESLARDGQQHPIIVFTVTVSPSPSYRIISGATRLAAASKLNWKFIQAKVVPGGAGVDHQIAELVENEFRADLSKSERTRMRARLKELRADQEKLLADALSELEDKPKAKGGRGKKGGLADAARRSGVPETTARRRGTKPRQNSSGEVSDDKPPADAPLPVDAETLALREKLAREIRADLGKEEAEPVTADQPDDDVDLLKDVIDQYKRDPSKLTQDIAKMSEDERQKLSLHCDEAIVVHDFFVKLRSLLDGTDAAPTISPATSHTDVGPSLPDNEITVEDDLEPHEYRSAFLLRAADCLAFVTYSGAVDDEIVTAAKRVVNKWQEFVNKFDPTATPLPSDNASASSLLTDALGALLICFERLRAPEGDIKASLSPPLYRELRRQFPLKRKRAQGKQQ